MNPEQPMNSEPEQGPTTVDLAPAEGFYTVDRPSRRERLRRRLFPRRPEPSFDPMPEWAIDGIHVRMTLFLPWRDRLRVLVSGRVAVVELIHCERFAGKTASEASVFPLPPGGTV